MQSRPKRVEQDGIVRVLVYFQVEDSFTCGGMALMSATIGGIVQ